MFQEYQNNTLIMFNKSNFRDKKEYKFDDAGNIPAFEETKRELEKFKEELETVKQELAFECGFENYEEYIEDRYPIYKPLLYEWEEREGILVPYLNKTVARGPLKISKRLKANRISTDINNIYHCEIPPFIDIIFKNIYTSNILQFDNDKDISDKYYKEFGSDKIITYYKRDIVLNRYIELLVKTFIYKNNPVNLIISAIYTEYNNKKNCKSIISRKWYQYDAENFKKRYLSNDTVNEMIENNPLAKEIYTPIEDLIFKKDYTQKDYDFIYNKYILPIITGVTN